MLERDKSPQISDAYRLICLDTAPCKYNSTSVNIIVHGGKHFQGKTE